MGNRKPSNLSAEGESRHGRNLGSEAAVLAEIVVRTIELLRN